MITSVIQYKICCHFTVKNLLLYSTMDIRSMCSVPTNVRLLLARRGLRAKLILFLVVYLSQSTVFKNLFCRPIKLEIKSISR